MNTNSTQNWSRPPGLGLKSRTFLSWGDMWPTKPQVRLGKSYWRWYRLHSCQRISERINNQKEQNDFLWGPRLYVLGDAGCECFTVSGHVITHRRDRSRSVNLVSVMKHVQIWFVIALEENVQHVITWSRGVHKQKYWLHHRSSWGLWIDNPSMQHQRLISWPAVDMATLSESESFYCCFRYVQVHTELKQRSSSTLNFAKHYNYQQNSTR